jgi:hypothetical protein
MKSLRSRQVILQLVAVTMGAGSLLVAGSALADTALFRVEQGFLNFPNPAVTTPGGAGKYQGYINPYLTKTAMGAYIYPAATAIVEPNNPIGGAFTLPQSFIDYSGTFTITPKTAWPGYSTITHSIYYNGPGVFGPNNGATAPTRVVFPTTMGNPPPNYGTGNPTPNAVTTTFDGLYDFSRPGSINVTPGPRRFGGTMRIFYRPEANFYQYIYYFDPAFYKAYGQFSCLDEGVFGCTPGTFKSSIGDTTAWYRFDRFLLNVKGTGTGDRLQSASAKATTPTTPYGRTPTANGQGTPNGSGPASYITGAAQYLNLIHPWTTGFASIKNPVGSPNVITPQTGGYDTDLQGADITVTRYDWNQVWDKTLSTLITTTATSKQYMEGVGRVVSMVRPRLIHTFVVPLDLTTDPITQTWPVARMWMLKVYFLPEPTGMLLLGTGIAALLGLARIRRR